MGETPNADALARAVRTLTVAVWCLCGFMVLLLAFYGWSVFQYTSWSRQMTTTSFTSHSSAPAVSQRPPVDEKPFYEMSPQDMVARSSVILVTANQDDGARYKAVVTEILKQDPGVRLYYSVGDEYPMLSRKKEKDVACGDGSVVFMVGSPASMRSSYSFANGRITGLGDMPLTKLREMIQQSKTSRQAPS